MDKNIRHFIKFIALEKRYSRNTIESYTNDLQQLSVFLYDYFGTESIFWDRINRQVLRSYMAYLQEELSLSRRSIARKLATLKSFFKYLARESVISHNPMSTMKMPRFEKKLPEYLTPDEVRALLELPEVNSFEGLRDLCILELFYGTGLRLAELIHIKVSNLMLGENLIRVTGKGNKERVVPIGTAAKTILEKYLYLRPQYASENDDTVFVLKSGKKMYPMAVQRIVGRYLNKVTDANHKSPHLLRHTYATHLLNAGASIRVVKDLLGHENLSTTQVYTHISIDHLKSIYKQAHPGASNTRNPNRRRS